MTLKCQWWSVLGHHRWQLHSQEPKFRSEIATSSPLFPMETTPPTAPSTCCPHCKAPSGSPVTVVCHTLWLSLFVLLLQWPSCSLPGTTWFPATAVYNKPADDFFLKWHLWQAYLGRVVIFTANFLDEDVFINLSKWSAHRVGIAQLTQCCVFSRHSLHEAHRRAPSLPLEGNERAAQQVSRPRLLLEYSHGHWQLEDIIGPRASVLRLNPVLPHPPC